MTLEGSAVSFTWAEGPPILGIVEQEYEDGGLRIKFGPAQWLYLPGDNPTVREIREQARIEIGE